MVLVACVLLVAVLAFSLALYTRLSRQVRDDPSYLVRAVGSHWRRRSYARPR